jgi:AAA15 family ATPase/GTPase
MFDYLYNKDRPGAWQVEKCRLSQTNLIVGKNASGKSRIVKSIYILSELLLTSGTVNPQPTTDEWHLSFDIDKPEQKTEYRLKIEKGFVIQEKLLIGNQELLSRKESGEGTIFAKELGLTIRFQIPKTELAVVKRRDSIQHPFLEDLYKWSNSLRFYEFGSQLGQDFMPILPTRLEFTKTQKQIDLKNYHNVVSIFVLGKQEIGDNFIQSIICDMKRIGYNISQIGTKVPSFYNTDISYPPDNQDNLPGILYVKEEDLDCFTEQSEISQGMFRALSLFVQINYSLLSSKPSCIVIDDIGEGLDYERSSSLIKILIEKAQTGLVQLIMTTNDEFIMNGVPLEYWSVIERKPGSAKLHNIFNSEDKFKQFQFIGLNNFDFFTSKFALQEELDAEEE